MKMLILVLGLMGGYAMAQAPATSEVPAAPAMPDAGAAMAKGKAMAKTAGDKAMVHINSASVEDLQKLPGIDSEKAQAIVEGRPYKSVNDLKKIKGIKESVLAKIKGMVSL